MVVKADEIREYGTVLCWRDMAKEVMNVAVVSVDLKSEEDECRRICDYTKALGVSSPYFACLCLQAMSCFVSLAS